jgi:hypothetical protein
MNAPLSEQEICNALDSLDRSNSIHITTAFTAMLIRELLRRTRTDNRAGSNQTRHHYDAPDAEDTDPDFQHKPYITEGMATLAFGERPMPTQAELDELVAIVDRVGTDWWTVVKAVKRARAGRKLADLLYNTGSISHPYDDYDDIRKRHFQDAAAQLGLCDVKDNLV